jgi:hypothetical protein
MEARDETHAPPVKAEGTTDNLQLYNAPQKPQSNPYLKLQTPAIKIIELFHVTNNRMRWLSMDGQGWYIKTGNYRVIHKPTDKEVLDKPTDKDDANDLLQDINIEDLDGISQPDYSYEDNKRKREHEESEHGDTNVMIGKIIMGLPKIITTQEHVNLLISKDKTQVLTPQLQETECIKIDTEETAEDDKMEVVQTNEQYEHFMVDIMNAIDAKVNLNMITQMTTIIASFKRLVDARLTVMMREQLTAMLTNVTPTLSISGFYRGKVTPQSVVTFASLSSTNNTQSPYHPDGTLQVPNQTPLFMGLDIHQDQEPVKLSGKDDKVQCIREDLELQHRQLQPKVIKLARVSLLSTKDIYIKLRNLGIMEQRNSNGDPLHIPKSKQCNMTYKIQEEHKNEAPLQLTCIFYSSIFKRVDCYYMHNLYTTCSLLSCSACVYVHVFPYIFQKCVWHPPRECLCMCSRQVSMYRHRRQAVM